MEQVVNVTNAWHVVLVSVPGVYHKSLSLPRPALVTIVTLLHCSHLWSHQATALSRPPAPRGPLTPLWENSGASTKHNIYRIISKENGPQQFCINIIFL